MPGSALAEQLVVKNWESKHENADDCYEAQNIQVAGIATPQDEMQKQKWPNVNKTYPSAVRIRPVAIGVAIAHEALIADGDVPCKRR